MKKGSGLEKLAGSLPVNTIATTIAAISGGPVAAMLPVLTATLASGRHKARVEAALNDIDQKLVGLGDEINEITDAQYKFINECVISILHSPDQQKIEYLKQGIINITATARMNLHDAGLISRILRDITVEEIRFIIENIKTKIVFHENSVDGCINVDKSTHDGALATGLVGLSLLTKEQGEGTWDDDGAYIFTPIAPKLLAAIT